MAAVTTAKWKALPPYRSKPQVEFAIYFGDLFQMVEQ